MLERKESLVLRGGCADWCDSTKKILQGIYSEKKVLQDEDYRTPSCYPPPLPYIYIHQTSN